MTPKLSEADLCAEFAHWAGGHGFTVYPEVQGWDLLLVVQNAAEVSLCSPIVRGLEIRSGDQIGVQAKLSGNMRVLTQALGSSTPDVFATPTFRVVLVDKGASDFLVIARELGLVVCYRQEGRMWRGKQRWYQRSRAGEFSVRHAPQERSVLKPLPLPPVVPDLPAGVPSPRQLTPWRVKALALCRVLRSKGYLTPADFKVLGIDRRVWIRKWVQPATTCGSCRDTGTVGINRDIPCIACGGTPKRYYPLDGVKLPDVGWESIQQQIEESK